MKILIVDDNPNVRQLTKAFLPASCEEVFECADGKETFGLYAKHLPDWVLMDWEMPKMDGITATRRIIKSFPNANICMVTAFDDEDLKQQAFEAGVSEFVLKDDLYQLKRVLAGKMEN
jgi:NarL family two-component system response regulator LiaR